MNEHISVMTDFGELIATPFAGGISVDINLPDGKGSGQLAFIESTPAELQDDYPTPVHVFSYDGRDSEPVHRTDVHLDGDAMTLDPVKGTRKRMAATGIPQISPRPRARRRTELPVRMRTRPAASSTRASMPTG